MYTCSLQIIVLNELIHRLSMSRFSTRIYCTIVSGHVCNMSWKSDLEIGDVMDSFCSIILAARGKMWYPPFPMADDVRTILPHYGFTKVNVHESIVEEEPVKCVHWIS